MSHICLAAMADLKKKKKQQPHPSSQVLIFTSFVEENPSQQTYFEFSLKANPMNTKCSSFIPEPEPF